LPPVLDSLYELTRADKTKLKTALKDGTITPDMKRREIVALLPSRKAPRRRSERGLVSARTPGGRLYFQIARLLSDEFEKLAPEDQEHLLGMLDQTLMDLRERRKGDAT
jgi:hypothetical protein